MTEGKTRRQRVRDSIISQNEQTEFEGQSGFWVQADCAFIPAITPQSAIEIYRRELSKANIGISHNFHCDALRETF